MQVSPRDIHHYERRLELALLNLRENNSLLEDNKNTIQSYLLYRQAQGLSIPRQVRYIFTITKLSSLMHNKRFQDATKDDLVNVISQIERGDTSFETKRTEKECIKCFYRWLKGGEDGQEYPLEVRWIKTKRAKNHNFLPQNLLTEAEVKLMAESCSNPRDRALVLLIYETGGRIGEILSLSLRAISFDKYGAILTAGGKTGDRRVRIIFSAGALAEWLNHHPANDDPDSPLWTSFDEVGSKRRLEYGALRKMLSTAAKRCGINKRVNPHSFRHARASNLANVLTEAQMKEYLGWVGDSKMAATYVHLSGRNVDNALFKLNGIKTADEINQEERPLKASRCERCHEINSPTNRFCSKCGSPLDVRTALEVQKEQETTDHIMNKLFENPKFRNAVEQALKVLK
jgi:integrase/recombinase XerD